jgi:hypothetical protein
MLDPEERNLTADGRRVEKERTGIDRRKYEIDPGI